MAKKRGNGTHSEWFDENKKLYRGSISLGRGEDGKLKRKSVSGKTLTEVRQKLKQIELQVFTGEFVDESTITISDLAKQIQEDKLNYNDISKATYYRNMETLKRLSPISETPLQRANETQLKAFLQKELNYSQSTLDKEYRMLNAVFKEAVKRKIIVDNPMENIKRMKSKKQSAKVRALTVEEQSKLINILQTEGVKYGAQMLVSLYTGMRMGEVNALTVKDINFNFNTININKTIARGDKGKAILNSTTKTAAGRRTIKLTEDVKPLLAECVKYAEGEYLFLNPRGSFINTNQVNMVLRRLFEKYEIIDNSVYGKVTCHSLRHTYATRCIEGGMPAKVLQKRLGHKDIAMTMNIYCDAFEQYEDKYMEIVGDYMKQQGLSLDSAAV